MIINPLSTKLNVWNSILYFKNSIKLLCLHNTVIFDKIMYQVSTFSKTFNYAENYSQISVTDWQKGFCYWGGKLVSRKIDHKHQKCMQKKFWAHRLVGSVNDSAGRSTTDAQ